MRATSTWRRQPLISTDPWKNANLALTRIVKSVCGSCLRRTHLTVMR